MKNKNIVGILIIISIFGLLWVVGKNKASNIQKESVKTENKAQNLSLKNDGGLTTTEKLYDMGTISMKEGLVSKIFQVSNPGTEDINLEKITTSCMCTKAYIINEDGNKSEPFGMPGHGGVVPKANEIIKAGETRNIEVVYDPNAHGPAGVGVIDRFVYLEDSNANKLTLEIKAIVTP